MKLKKLKLLANVFIISLLSNMAFNKAMAEEKNPFRTFDTYKGIGYEQAYRPAFHFTSIKNWINDPNGLMYYDGEYHLFFQHNPLGTGWGNMTWGHAVSTDLVHWKQLAHAITPYGKGYVFSGTGVVDHNNSLGKQMGNTKTLVLMYSYAVDARKGFGILTPPKETKYYQGLAYSTDRGRTFKLLNDGAPVIPFQGRNVDPKGTERDPKLFWHEGSKKWVTLLWLGESSGGKVRIFSSDDLQKWKFESDIVRPWAHECFDLFELPVLDADGNLPNNPQKKWLIYDGSFDYEIGSFDGKKFKSEQALKNHKLGHWNAAQTFNNSPDGRRIIVGWLKKSDFWRKKMPFTEQLSFPAIMQIRRTPEGIRLYRWPVKEIEKLYGKQWRLPKGCSISVANEELKNIDKECLDMSIEFTPGKDKDLELNIRGSKLSFNATKNTIHFISKSNLSKKSTWDAKSVEEKKDRKNHRFKYDQYVMNDALNNKGTVKLRILVDRGSFEIFLNDGITVLTHSELHDLDNRSISFSGGSTLINSMKIHEVKSSWKTSAQK